jgi:hypothetical protein
MMMLSSVLGCSHHHRRRHPILTVGETMMQLLTFFHRHHRRRRPILTADETTMQLLTFYPRHHRRPIQIGDEKRSLHL